MNTVSKHILSKTDFWIKKFLVIRDIFQCDKRIMQHREKFFTAFVKGRSRWPRGLRRESAGRSLAGIAGSNPADEMDVSLSLLNAMCCQ